MSTVLYYIPVKKEYIGKWEYYDADFELLKDSGFNVVVCSGFFEVFFNIIKCDFLYAWWWGRSLPVIVLSKIFRKKIVTTGAIHMYDLSGSGSFHDKKFYYRWLNGLGLYLTDVNLFISRHQKLSIQAYFKNATGEVLYPSLSSKFQSASDIEISNRKNILVFAWLTHVSCLRKGVYDAVRAYARLLSKEPELIADHKLIIAGKCGDALPQLVRMVSDFDIGGNVVFELDVSQDEKLNLYKSSYCLLAPSYMEGFGNANLEAMCCGLPVICTSEGASKEAVFDAGIVVNDVGVDAAVEGLKKMLALSYEEIGVMRNRARDRAVSHFSEEVRIKNLMKILAEERVI